MDHQHRRGPAVTAVIPTLNEARNLREVLPRLPARVDELVIVDGGSTDGTTEVARTLRPDAVVLQQTGQGKGDALLCGARAATGDIVVLLDADGSTDPAEIPRFVTALVRGADFAKGTRYQPEGGSEDLTGLRSVGNRALTQLVNVVYGTSYTDLCYGYNAFWRHHLDAVLDEDAPGFECETLMNIRAVTAGLRVVEVPSYERVRVHGTSNLSPVRDGLRVLRTIIRERTTRSPRPTTAPRPASQQGQA